MLTNFFPTYDYVLKFGENLDVDTAYETLWDAGGLYPWDEFAGSDIALELVSDSVNDTAAGTGARTVTIYGTTSYALAQETVTLDGTTPVALAASYNSIYRLTIDTAGAGKTSAGTVSLNVAGAGATVGQVVSGNNQSLMAVYTVPTTHDAYITRIYCTVGKGKDCAMTIFVRPSVAGVFQNKGTWGIYQQTLDHNYGDSPLYIPAGGDIEMRVISESVNTPVRGGFDLRLAAV